jgi:hypothetical protein
VAQKVQVLLVDDLDNGTADETVSFSLDGVAYEIDVSSENAKKMRDAFAVYVGAGRRVSGRSGGGQRRTRGQSGRSGKTAEIRQWAKDNGFTVNERGRIPSHVVEAYDKAHA